MRSFKCGITAVMVTVVGLGSLAGCGSDDDSNGTADKPTAAASSSKKETATAAPQDTATPTPTQHAGQYIVMLAEVGSLTELRFIDPATKQVVGSRGIAVPEGYASQLQNTGIMTGAQKRSVFNGDFTSFGATDPNGTNNDIVGSVRVDDGSFAKAIEESSDGGFGVEVERGAPVYGGDGRLYYVEQAGEDRAVKSVGADQQSKTETNFATLSRRLEADDPVYIFPRSSAPQDNYDAREAYALDDSWGFREGNGNGFVDYGDLSHQQNMARASKPQSSNGGFAHVEPAAYLDRFAYISLSAGTHANNGTELNRVDVVNGKLKVTPLVIPTDGQISDPVVSPKGDKVSFLFEKGDATAVYSVNTDAPRQTPKLVYELEAAADSAHYNLLDWAQLSS